MSQPDENKPVTDVQWPATPASLADDLRALGVLPGMTLVVHTSMKALGPVIGGPVSVILALEDVLGPDGTLVMPAHTPDLSDPANWQYPPVPEAWWQLIRDTMPAFEVDLTPTRKMGIIAETFRKQNGVVRSSHPTVSFAAWGRHAHQITANHELLPYFGEQSPLVHTYNLDGWILLLGVGHGNNTALHVAERRASIPHKRYHTGSPIMVDGVRQWVAYDEIDWDDSDFVQLGADFARETSLQREGKIAGTDAILIPQRPLTDYAVTWFERHRRDR